MEMCTSITGRGSRTIRDLMQFATFTTNFRYVCVIFAKRDLTRSVRKSWKRRYNELPEQKACTTYPIPCVIFATNL